MVSGYMLRLQDRASFVAASGSAAGRRRLYRFHRGLLSRNDFLGRRRRDLSLLGRSTSCSRGMVLAAACAPARSHRFPAGAALSGCWLSSAAADSSAPATLSRGYRPHHLGRHDHQQLRVALRPGAGLKQLSQQRNAGQAGDLLSVSVRVLSSSPAITKLWPLSSSTSVWIFRVDSAGIVNPSKVTALSNRGR